MIDASVKQSNATLQADWSASQAKIDATVAELKEERDAVRELSLV